MTKKRVFLLTICVVGMFLVLAGTASAVTRNVPADYATIQAAVTAADPGDIIQVGAGTYPENVTVDKSLNLTGASSSTVTVTAANPAVSVFTVTASSVTISGFTANGATGEGQAGIYLSGGLSNCNFSNNSLTGNFDGIWLGSGSNYNTVTNNTANLNTRQGFEVYISSNNTFTGNTASSNTSYGFKIDSGNLNAFTGNTANSNGKYGFYSVIGDGGGTTNSTFTNNTANSNTQYGIRINGGSGNTLTGNTFNLNAIEGLRFKEGITNLTVKYNNITNSPTGVYIDVSVPDVTTWTVTNNNISGNTSGVTSNSVAGTLNATNNWWGSAFPVWATTITGSGRDRVAYSPWLLTQNPVSATYNQATTTTLNVVSGNATVAIPSGIAGLNGETVSVYEVSTPASPELGAAIGTAFIQALPNGFNFGANKALWPTVTLKISTPIGSGYKPYYTSGSTWVPFASTDYSDVNGVEGQVTIEGGNVVGGLVKFKVKHFTDIGGGGGAVVTGANTYAIIALAMLALALGAGLLLAVRKYEGWTEAA